LPETEASNEHFLRLLKERQANKCAVIVKPPGRIKTIGAHIIRRSIAKADKSNAGLHISLPATWDILRHYADLSEDTIRDLENIIDSPSNGILLQTEMHDGFDDFEWYFEATDQPDVYNIKWLSEDGPLGTWVTGGLEQVQFTNQSANDIPLPNAQFLAIHAAIAKVLHLSGAAEPLDLVRTGSILDRLLCPLGSMAALILPFDGHFLNCLETTLLTCQRKSEHINYFTLLASKV